MLCLSGFELYSRWVPLKRRQFPRGWRVAYGGFFFTGGGGGGAYRGFFPGGLSQIGELLIKKTTSSLLSRLSVISLLPVFKTSIS